MKRTFGSRVAVVLGADAESFRVRLRFDDGLEVAIDLSPLFVRPRGLASEVLKGGAFARCFVESGALAWPNGLELCPDTLRSWAEKQLADAAA